MIGAEQRYCKPTPGTLRIAIREVVIRPYRASHPPTIKRRFPHIIRRAFCRTHHPERRAVRASIDHQRPGRPGRSIPLLKRKPRRHPRIYPHHCRRLLRAYSLPRREHHGKIFRVSRIRINKGVPELLGRIRLTRSRAVYRPLINYPSASSRRKVPEHHLLFARGLRAYLNAWALYTRRECRGHQHLIEEQHLPAPPLGSPYLQLHLILLIIGGLVIKRTRRN